MEMVLWEKLQKKFVYGVVDFVGVDGNEVILVGLCFKGELVEIIFILQFIVFGYVDEIGCILLEKCF